MSTRRTKRSSEETHTVRGKDNKRGDAREAEDDVAGGRVEVGGEGDEIRAEDNASVNTASWRMERHEHKSDREEDAKN